MSGTPYLEQGSGFRKLLSSHLSVYNALVNPELDENVSNTPSPKITGGKDHKNESHVPPRSLSSGLELCVGIGDRQSPIPTLPTVNLPTDTLPDFARLFRLNSPFSCPSPRPASASILSNSTDDELPSESLVMVPSVSKLKVLVFETDEEDNDLADEGNGNDLCLVPSATGGPMARFDDDDQTLTSRTDAHSMPLFLNSKNTHQSFVMPKMSLSQDCAKFQLTILSSNTDFMIQECNALVAMIECAVFEQTSHLHISHLALSKIPEKVELALIHNSNSVFIVNDGLLVLGETMAAVSRSIPKGVEFAKVTVINILTANYFINLFDIINSVTPFQIWKTSTLKTDKLSDKIKAFVESEMASQKMSKERQKGGKRGRRGRRSKPGSGSISKSRTKNPQSTDYKALETSIQNELVSSLTLTYVDPLNFSSSLSHLRVLIDSLPKVLPFGSGDDPKSVKRLLVVYGVSLGLAMGVILGTERLVRIAYDQYDKFRELSQLAPTTINIDMDLALYSNQLGTVLVTEKFKVAAEFFLDGLDDVYSHYVKESPCGEIASSFGMFLNRLVKEVKLLSASVADSAKGGLDKSTSMLTSIFD